LEGEHPEPVGVAVADHTGDLVQVPRGDGPVVRQEVPNPVLLPEPREHGREPLPVGVQRSLIRWSFDAAAPEHQDVEMPREGHPVQPRAPVGVQGQVGEVVVGEVDVAHAHRLPTMFPHNLEGRGVVIGREQAHLTADELGVRAGAAGRAEQPQLCGHGGAGVGPVDRHPVGVREW